MSLVPGDSGLGIFAPAAVAARVDEWRRVCDPYQETIAPHVTVAYPPFVPTAEWPLVRPALAECLRGFPPFRITLQDLEFFAGPPLVLWLRPEDDGTLVRLRAALEERFPGYVPPYPLGYVPHVTVGFFDSPAALDRARATILQELVPLHFQVDDLVYMVFDDGVWRVRDLLPFGGVASTRRSV